MTLNTIVSDLEKAMEATREKLKALAVRIEEVEAKRNKIIQTKPHADDILEAFMRGVTAAAASYEERLRQYFDPRLMDDKTPALIKNAAPQALTIDRDPQKPVGTPWGRTFLPPGGLGVHQRCELDAAAVAYFMSDAIAEKMPEIVARLYGTGGMRHCDRVAEMDVLDKQLATLNEEREGLLAELQSARKAVQPRRDPWQI